MSPTTMLPGRSALGVGLAPAHQTPGTTHPDDQTPNARAHAIWMLLVTLRNRNLPRDLTAWKAYPLPLTEYIYLLNRIERDGAMRIFVDTHIWYDYSYHPGNTEDGTLTLRTPLSVRHTAATLEFEKCLDAALAAFAERERWSKLHVDHVTKYNAQRGPVRVRLESGTRTPDMQWACAGQRPAVILEISVPRSEKSLSALAKQYLLESRGTVQVVLCLDLGETVDEYASLTVWRRAPNVQGVRLEDTSRTLSSKTAVLRNLHDEPQIERGVGLRLELEDFAQQDLIPDLSRAGPIPGIVIPTSKLCKTLAGAERFARFFEQRTKELEAAQALQMMATSGR